MNRSILVVDDEMGLRSMLGWQLAANGFRVVTVEDGEKAVSVLRDQRFDLVITDLSMPFLEGTALLEHVKSRWPKTPVIVMSGFVTPELAVRVMKRGADDLLMKPFHLQTLFRAVEEALTPPQSPP